MIIREKKIIFIHIPKTGGTSIEDVITSHIRKKKNPSNLYGVRNGKALQHLTALEIKNRIDNYDNFLKFVVVRNPYDRLISEYYWCQVKGVGKRSGQSFDNFLKYTSNIVKSGKFDKNIYTDHFIPQYKFVYDENSNKIVDKIFYFENFEEVLKFSAKICESHSKSTHRLKNKNKNKIKLNEDQKSIIYETYKKDFELFNYKK